jgi:hypothetical protein
VAYFSCEIGNFQVAGLVGSDVNVNATGVLMIGTSHVIAVARFVRHSATAFVVIMLVSYLAVQAFASHYSGLPSTHTVVAVPAADNTALATAISEQVSRGLTCREEPTLTDTILFQGLGDAEVQVLTFEQAIAASSARTGWIRRYCF